MNKLVQRSEVQNGAKIIPFLWNEETVGIEATAVIASWNRFYGALVEGHCGENGLVKGPEGGQKGRKGMEFDEVALLDDVQHPTVGSDLRAKRARRPPKTTCGETEGAREGTQVLRVVSMVSER